MSKPRIDAVVFDTNVFGAGMSVGILAEWKELLGRRGMELWIPELVLWEAAVHVADAAQETDAQFGLFEYQKASPQAIRDVLEFLAESKGTFGSGHGLFDAPDFDHLDELFTAMGGGDGFGFREADAQIVRLGDLVGLRVLETDPALGALEVEAWFLGDLELQGWVDVDSGGDMHLRMRSEEFLNCVLKMPLSLSANQGQINFGTLAGPVRVTIGPGRTSGDGALLRIVEALSLIPGPEEDDMLSDLEERGEWKGRLVNGLPLALSVYETDYKNPGESFSMEAQSGEDRCVISWRCTADFSIFDDEYLDESECYFMDEHSRPGLWNINIWLLHKMRSLAP